MSKNKTLMTAVILLIILGIVMIYLGSFGTPQLMLPPILTGAGFFVIAFALASLRK